jgi:hypothetical protein
MVEERDIPCVGETERHHWMPLTVGQPHEAAEFFCTKCSRVGYGQRVETKDGAWFRIRARKPQPVRQRKAA